MLSNSDLLALLHQSVHDTQGVQQVVDQLDLEEARSALVRLITFAGTQSRIQDFEVDRLNGLPALHDPESSAEARLAAFVEWLEHVPLGTNGLSYIVGQLEQGALDLRRMQP